MPTFRVLSDGRLFVSDSLESALRDANEPVELLVEPTVTDEQPQPPLPDEPTGTPPDSVIETPAGQDAPAAGEG